MRASHEIKQRQKKFINEKLQPLERIEYEGNYYHDFFRSLPFVALKQLLDRMSLSLNQKTVLVAGCGVGTDIHYLSKHYTGVEFIVCDLSEEAVKICIKNWPTARGYVEDIERLTFADESFDFVFVANTLHHLPRPLIGLYECLRVAKEGVIVIGGFGAQIWTNDGKRV